MAELDEDHDGKLSYNEFLPFTVELLQALFAKQEMDHEREETEAEAREEVEEFLLHGMPRSELENMMMDIFQRADIDGSGSLDRNEFRECLKAAELGLTRKEVNAILSEVDENQDGNVSYTEFMPLCFNILVERFKVNTTSPSPSPSFPRGSNTHAIAYCGAHPSDNPTLPPYPFPPLPAPLSVYSSAVTG